jgi:cysteine desulfurase/selenocysteine lyase
MCRLGNQKDMYVSLNRIRVAGAKIFGCRKGEIGFGFNTTFGINLAAFGLPLNAGDEVLLPDVEFPANVYPWLELRNRGITISFVNNDRGRFSVDLFRNALSKKTRAVAVSAVQFFNGFKNDLAELGDLCKERGLFFVVDSMQAAGCEPLAMKRWKVDIASAGGQKWLLSPQGTGIFYISDEMKENLRPPWRSWLGVDWGADWTDLINYGRPFEQSAQQYELGTYPVGHLHAFAWSLGFITNLGLKNVQQHNHALLDTLAAYLNDEPAYEITSDLCKRHRSSILTFTTTKADVRNLHRRLVKQGIITALREGSIRVSVHLYNNTSDIEALIGALRTAAKGN